MDPILLDIAKVGGGALVIVVSIVVISKMFISRISDKDKTQTEGFTAQNQSYVNSISEITKTFTEVMDRQTIARNAETAKTLETMQLMQLEMGKKTIVLNKMLEVQEANSERLLKLESDIHNQYAEIKSRQAQIDAEIKKGFAELYVVIGKSFG